MMQFNSTLYFFTSPISVVEELVTKAEQVQDGDIKKTRQQQS